MSVKVDVEKSEKSRLDGNASFKRGKWTEAIEVNLGHYTNAIIYNSTNPIAYSNRAQAFLKLDKYKDAERDCTTCLSLDSQKQNVKALYRRGLARKGLGEIGGAIEDLQAVLKIEKSNETVKSELEELLSMEKELDKKKSKPRRPIAPPSIPSSAAKSDPRADLDQTTISSGASIQEISDQPISDPNHQSSTLINEKNGTEFPKEDSLNGSKDTSSSTNSGSTNRSFASLRNAREGKKKAFVNSQSSTSSITQSISKVNLESEEVVSNEDDLISISKSTSIPRNTQSNSQIPSSSIENKTTTQPSTSPAQTQPSTTTPTAPPKPNSNTHTTPLSTVETTPSLPTDLDVNSTSSGSGLILLRYLSTSPNPSSKAYNHSLISLYPPGNIPKILVNLLEPDNLSLILEALDYGLSHLQNPSSANSAKEDKREKEKENEREKEKERTKVILEGFRNSKRWKINYNMLSKREKTLVESLWRDCGCQGELK